MKKSVPSFWLILSVFILAACTRAATQSGSAATCKLNLNLFVRQGPNIHDSLSGQVMFGASTWSSFAGELVEEDRTSHPASFSFDGQAIHFMLDAKEGHIFGVGMMESSLSDCTGEGGGTLSGPALGDLGDWRGEWIQEQIKTTPQPPQKEAPLWDLLSSLCPTSSFIAIALIVGFILFRLFVPTYKLQALFQKPGSSTGKSTTTLRRASQAAGRQPEGSKLPLAEYLATYTPEDKLFDLSFDIEKSARYLGECGLTVAKASGMEPSQVTAFEFWLFDALDVQDIQANTAKILMSDYSYSQSSLRKELEPKGQAVTIQPGEIIELTTKGLIARAKILQVEYELSTPNPKSVFKKLVIKIGVWARTA
jgi:hypothetical protein